MIKKMLTPVVLLLFLMSAISCQREVTQNEVQNQVLKNELSNAKLELKEALRKQETPILEIVNSYRNAHRDKSLLIQEDFKLGYERMIARFKLFRAGKLSEEAYWADVNGAFEDDAPFATGVGKRISEYYATEFREKRPARQDEAYKKYIKVQQIRKEISQNATGNE